MEQVVAPAAAAQPRPGTGPAMARELAALSVRLHAALMGSALAEAGLDVAGLEWPDWTSPGRTGWRAAGAGPDGDSGRENWICGPPPPPGLQV